MIIVDKALAQRAAQGNPIRVAIAGAGYSGRRIAYQIMTAVPGMRVVAIANRTVASARSAYADAGVAEVLTVDSPSAVDDAIRGGRFCVAEDPAVLCAAEGVDLVIECTGTVEPGARTVLEAIEHRKHVVVMNVELDATVGPILKAKADANGVVYSNSDGDEPGVAMNMIRFVRSIGLKPVVAGNLKGLYDPYRNPDTQREFAERVRQKPTTMTHFADGTKLSMELNVLANATGFKVGKRGMYGPALTHVNEAAAFFRERLIATGMVDFTVGAAPANGAFVVGHTEDPVRMDYLKYLKMGDGPLYVFYTPFHLPHLEIPLTAARAALFGDAAVTPAGPPSCDSVAVAKRDLKEGETLDGIGGFTAYALLENYETSRAQRLLPMGLAEGCRVRRAIAKDTALTYDDVDLPKGRLCDALRREQDARFA
ncbi:MAG: SAF domain-containing protein [Pseudomonadota bacterium]